MSRRREILGKQGINKRKCKTFLTPMLDMPLMHVSDNHNYFIDVGFTTVGYPQIVYVFDKVDYEPLKMDIYKLQNHHSFSSAEFADNDREVVIYLNVPKEFRKDFDKFIEGKYSEFSEQYKAILIKKYGEGRQAGVNPKNGLPNVSIYDAIYPEEAQKKLLAECLNSKNSKVDWKDIKEVVSPVNIETEKFKTIEELEEEYGVK